VHSNAPWEGDLGALARPVRPHTTRGIVDGFRRPECLGNPASPGLPLARAVFDQNSLSYPTLRETAVAEGSLLFVEDTKNRGLQLSRHAE
jgi:hypothetical protein